MWIKTNINILCVVEPREGKHCSHSELLGGRTKAVLEKQYFYEILPDRSHQGLPRLKATLLKKKEVWVLL